MHRTTMPPINESPHVVRASSERMEEAMGALLGSGPAAATRFVRQAESARIALDHIWCLADGFGRFRMAVVSIPSPGRAAMLLASHARDPMEAAALGVAIRAAIDGSKGFADLVQALVEPSRPFDIMTFEAGGMQRMATLDYLERALPRLGALETPAPQEGWTIALAASEAILGGSDPLAIDPQTRAELVGVLDRSYEDTRDCPGLAGMRRTSDVLDGHFGLGARPRHWFVARQSGVAHGVCLMNINPDRTGAELVYLGLAPEARGRGIARALLATGLRACSLAGCRAVSLAVDERNSDARKLYEKSGFRKTSSRIAFVCPTHRRAP